MHRARPGWLLLAMVAAVLRGEEKSAPAPSRPPAASTAESASIEGAKQQFELMKSARDSTPNPGTALPRPAMPELHSVPREAPQKSPSLKPEGSAKSGNWLVEAMEKGRDPRNPGERRERDRERDRDGQPKEDSERLATRTSRTEMQSDAERVGREKPAEAAPANPLAPYLSQWMTPKDYALLGSKIDRGAGDFLARPDGSSGTAVQAAAPAAVMASRDPASNGGPGAKPSLAKPPDNPYLQGLSMPAVAAAVPAPPAASGASVPTPPAASVYAAPPPPASPRPKVPDFVKPQTDEKYFKQLKRF